MMEEIARLPSDIAKAAARSLENIRVPNLTICNADKRNPPCAGRHTLSCIRSSGYRVS